MMTSGRGEMIPTTTARAEGEDALAGGTPVPGSQPMLFAYADPPYFGKAKRLYDHGEWDAIAEHRSLVESLVRDFPDGWALSCNPKDLQWLLPMLPEDARVCAWVKTFHQVRRVPVQYAWEVVVIRGGRPGNRVPMVRDWYISKPTRETGTIGAKPAGFCAWVLALLGYRPHIDVVVDLFPGSGIMERVMGQGVLT